MKLNDKIDKEVRKLDEVIDLFNEVKLKDESYFLAIEEEMKESQLVLWTVLSTCRIVVEEKQAKELVIIYSVFWNYYKRRKNLLSYSINFSDFNREKEKFTAVLNSMSMSKSEDESKMLFDENSSKVKSLVLEMWIIGHWIMNEHLSKLDDDYRYFFQINMRALICCFDRLEYVS